MSARHQRIMFDPPWWAVLVNAHFLPRRALARAMRQAAGSLRGALLDVGCGTQPYREMLSNTDIVTGLELDTPANRASKLADVFYDGSTLPFDEASFDSILCNQVLEHVAGPEDFLLECCRVLRPGGTLVLSVPFAWPEHEQPADHQRLTSFGLAKRLQNAGFEVLCQYKLVAGGGALMALLADQVNASLSGLPALMRIPARAILVAPLSIMGAILSMASSADPTFYLDNFVVARKV